MQTPDETLNSEANEIAGNRPDGPIGNTATHATGLIVGQPGGEPGHGPVGHDSAHDTTEKQHRLAARTDAADTNDTTSRMAPAADVTNTGNAARAAAEARAHEENKASSPNRGAFGVKADQGATHAGFGNQFREGITEHQGPADKQYYGDGVVRPGSGDHNAYLSYDGRDQRPDVLPTPAERIVADTPTSTSSSPVGTTPPPADNRNQPGRTDVVAAFQNDNGSAKAQGSAYAADYGHTSGVGLPRTSAESQAPPTVDGRNQAEDYHSMRGGYEPQAKPDATPATGAAPASSGPTAPAAPQGEGYGYQKSEQPKPTDPNTGSTRQGAMPGTQLAQHGGDTSQGYGSKGGSYDDQNPGAHPEGLDKDTSHSQNAQNGPGTRSEHRPDGAADHSYGPAPRRNEGRDEAAE